MKKMFRKIHRWLGLLLAVQILAWMTSGLYFALFPIESIRGEHLATPPANIDPVLFEESLRPGHILGIVSASLGPDAIIKAIELKVVDGVPAYHVEGEVGQSAFMRRIHAIEGRIMPKIDQDMARRIAGQSVLIDSPVNSVTLVDEQRPGSEYRGRRLPLWRVSYAGGDSLNVYIDAWSGEVAARRTQNWRIFDFLWMLHIMDFSERDDFNTPLLQISALLGLVLALSGLVYWGMTTRIFQRRLRR